MSVDKAIQLGKSLSGKSTKEPYQSQILNFHTLGCRFYY